MALDAEYIGGRAGSRDQLARFVAMLPSDEAAVRATAAAQPHDATFVDFLQLARRVGAEVEVVSDGYGFYVEPALTAMGITGVPITSAVTSWTTGEPVITFPNGHPECFVCGTCKRQRVLAQQALGRHTVMVGDGVSDRYGAAHADTVFAKSHLARICRERGWAYEPWETFDEISAWLTRVAAAPDRISPPRARAFICGPEAWGPGRHDPPPEG